MTVVASSISVMDEKTRMVVESACVTRAKKSDDARRAMFSF